MQKIRKLSTNMSFNEWLKIRDPLLHEQINENWKANTAGLLMGLGNSMVLAQSPTTAPTTITQQQTKPAFNLEAFKKLINTNPNSLDQIKSKHNKFEENIGNIYKQLIDPEFQKQNNISDKDILKELQKLYNQIPTANIFIVKNNYVIVPDGVDPNKLTSYGLNPQQIQIYKNQQDNYNKIQQEKEKNEELKSLAEYSPENTFKEDIIVTKVVKPIEYIRMAQINKYKFDKDFTNLTKPTDNDIGFATNKEEFNKPIRLIVVNDRAMDIQTGRNTIAFATKDHKGRVVVMRKSAFAELPSETSIGKLKPHGLQTLAHELRHTTQDSSKTPESRIQYDDPIADITKKTWKKYKHYMHDPREMGVRIAAIKNLTSSETISNYLGDDTVSQTIKMSLPKDEKQLLNLILNNDLWKKQIIQNNPKLQQKEIEQKIDHIIERIKLLNTDADSLIDFYKRLNQTEQ